MPMRRSRRYGGGKGKRGRPRRNGGRADGGTLRDPYSSRRNEGQSFLRKRSRPDYDPFYDESDSNNHNYGTRTRTRVKLEEPNQKNSDSNVSDPNVEPATCARCLTGNAKMYCENFEICGRVFHEENCGEVRGAYKNQKTSEWRCFECTAKQLYIKEKEDKPYLGNSNFYDSRFSFDGNDCERYWCNIDDNDTDGLIPQIGDKFYFIPQAYELFATRFFDIMNFVENPFTDSQKMHESADDKQSREFRNLLRNGNVTSRRGKDSNSIEPALDTDDPANIAELLDNIIIWPFDRNRDLLENERLVEVLDVAYEFPKVRNKSTFNKHKKWLTV